MRAVEFYLVKYMTKDSATATLSTLVPHCPDEELAGAWCLPSHSPLPAGAPRLTPASETAAGARRGAGWRLPSPPSPLPAGAPRLTACLCGYSKQQGGGWSEAGGCGAAPPNSCAATGGSGTCPEPINL